MLPNILHTYSAERRTVAKELIDFDRKFAKMFSAKPKTANSNQKDNVDPKEFQKYFEKHGRFTAGTAIQYYPSIISSNAKHQHLASGLKIGMRFHSAPVIRVADVKPIELGHTIRADGRWRFFIFANSDKPENPISTTNALINFLNNNEKSPIVKFTKADEDIDSIFDVRVIFQQPYRKINLEKINPFLLPQKGKLGLRDYEKVFCIDSKNGEDIYKMRKINTEKGCLVVVRPDQHIANILPLGAFKEISQFFDKFMTKR